MLIFFINFLLAGLVLFAFWVLSKGICWKEALSQLGIQTVFILAMCLLIKNAHLSDTEILNGRIVSKNSAHVSCSHSYQCHCYTSCSGSGKSRSCTRRCRTCYEHSFDVDWFADTNIKKRVYISRVDRQGLREPSRWSSILMGEPASFEHSYQNYIKADPDSLFQHHMEEEETKKYPKYPGRVYDYYRLNRGLGIHMEREISEVNADIGPAVGANLILVATELPISYAKLLQRAWEGAKKNDIVVVVGVAPDYSIKWTEVIGIAYPDFKVKLRNTVNDHGKLDLMLLPEIKTTIMKDFKRRSMSEFEYLKESYKPTRGEWILSLIVSLLLSAGLGFFFHKNETFGSNKYKWR